MLSGGSTRSVSTKELLAWAILIALGSVASGGTIMLGPVSTFLKENIRALVTGIMLLVAATSTVRIIMSGRFLKPSLTISLFVMLNFVIAAKQFLFGHVTQSILSFLGAIAIYLVFDQFARVRLRNMSLNDGMKAIAIGNFFILLFNLIFWKIDGLLAGSGRLTGLSANPNILAYSLVFTSMFLYSLVSPRHGYLKTFLFFGIMLIPNFAIILATGSRGAMAIFAFGHLIILLLSAKNKIAFRALALVTIPSALIFMFSFEFQIRLLSIFETLYVGRENTRNDVMAGQLERFWTSPVFGGAWDQDEIIYGENLFLGALAELGAVGFVLMFLFLASAFKDFVRAYRQNRLAPESKFESQVLNVFFVSLILANFLEALLLGRISSVLFTLFFVLALLSRSDRSPNELLIRESLGVIGRNSWKIDA